MAKWDGVFPAVTTKLDQSQRIDLDQTRASVDRIIEAGVNGIVVNPMLGESSMLSYEEKVLLVESAIESVAGRVPVLSGLAENTEEDAVRFAMVCQERGLDGLMVFPSLTYHTDMRESVNYYRSIASAVPDIDIMLYNNPGAYRVDITPDMLRELSDAKNIVCIKEESYDIRRVTDIYRVCGDRFLVFCGVDDFSLESFAAGASGWVSGMANVWPTECVQLFNLCRRGKYEEARGLYRVLIEAFHLDTDVKLIQYIKYAEALLFGSSEVCRSPRLALVGDEREWVKRVVEETEAALAKRRGVHH